MQLPDVAVINAGATIDSYYLGGTNSGQVTPPGKLTVTQMNASQVSGRIYAQFALQLTQTADELAAGLPIM